MASLNKDLTTTTAEAAKKSATIGSTREGRDMLTRSSKSGKVVKGVDTHGRQWDRYSP